jgi:hypothetical protein
MNVEPIPGNLAIEQHDYEPIYGLILPKEKFLEYFEKVKGNWPEGKNESQVYEQFGHYLPTENKLVLSKEKFLEDEALIGIKPLGRHYNFQFERELSYEILKLPRKIFDMKDLKLIEHVRRLAFLEAKSNPEIIPEFNWLINYFSGNHKGKPSNANHIPSGERELINLLRNCEFPEENIFS